MDKSYRAMQEKAAKLLKEGKSKEEVARILNVPTFLIDEPPQILIGGAPCQAFAKHPIIESEVIPPTAEKGESLRQIVDKSIKFLKAQGFTIQRYNAYSTNSVYLKLDYGVCNSIRFSDHAGKKHLAYRYNLLTDIEKMNDERNERGLKRSYYPVNWLDVMLQDIVRDREEKLRNYGEDLYARYMRNNKREGEQDTKGFWSKCYLI